MGYLPRCAEDTVRAAWERGGDGHQKYGVPGDAPLKLHRSIVFSSSGVVNNMLGKLTGLGSHKSPAFSIGRYV